MKPDHAEKYASLILRLLLDGRLQPHETIDLDWSKFLKLAKHNGVLLRTANQLERTGLKPPAFFSDAVDEERHRVQSQMRVIDNITQTCSKNNIGFIFPKAFHHYPDMGHDIDLFVLSHSAKIDFPIIESLQAVRLRRDFCNVMAGTINYKVPGCESLLEIHHGRMGRFGEDKNHLAAIIRNAKHTYVAGIKVLLPSREDQLILQSMQGIYGRLYIRLSDLFYTFSSILTGGLDWAYIISTANRLGIFHGLCYYLGYAHQIYHYSFKCKLFPVQLKKSFISSGFGRAQFRGSFYRFPWVRITSLAYSRKLQLALLSGDIEGASRLCLAPLVVIATSFRKLKLRCISSQTKEQHYLGSPRYHSLNAEEPVDQFR